MTTRLWVILWMNVATVILSLISLWLSVTSLRRVTKVLQDESVSHTGPLSDVELSGEWAILTDLAEPACPHCGCEDITYSTNLLSEWACGYTWDFVYEREMHPCGSLSEEEQA